MRYAFFGLLVLAFTSACSQFGDLEDVDGVDYNAEFAVPLVDSRFSMQDLLENFEEDASLTVEPDGLLRFQYSGEVFSKTADDIFATINQDVGSLPIPLTSSYQPLPFTSPNGLQFDQLDLKQGTMLYTLPNTHSQPVTITITLPNVTLNDQPLTIQRTVPGWSGTGTPPSALSLPPVNLAGYRIVPENDSLYVNYQAVDADGNTFDPPGNSILLFQELAFQYAEGYLGKERYVGGRDTIEIDFFDNWIQGDVWFEDPVITFSFENSFGIPTRSEINVFEILTVEGEVLPLESTFVTNGIDFPYPTLDQIGQVKTTEFVFNKDNSNIREVLGAGPIAVDYDINALTNPEEDPSIRGFITDSSYYRVQVYVDLPLHGSAVDFSVLDTFDLNLDDFNGVGYAEFKMVAENSMPVSIALQGYFLDETSQVLDSLFSGQERIIRGAPVDEMGLPTGSQRAVTYSDFSDERFARILPAKRLALVATFYTTTDGQQSVKIRSDQDVRVQLGAILGVSDDN